MSRMAARVVDRVLKRSNGTIEGMPRIYNVDRDTYSLGYTEINTQATSSFSRIKTHKAWFSGTSDVQNGDLILDRADGKYYLVMSVKNEISGGITAYIDGTLYYCDAVCQVQRFEVGTVNAFGRSANPAPSVVASNVYIMSQSMSMDSTDQPDQAIAKEKIKVAVQSKIGVQVNDRLVSSNGNSYRVITVDKNQLEGLDMLYVDKDVR